jgi:hypothetical protein
MMTAVFMVFVAVIAWPLAAYWMARWLRRLWKWPL